MQIFILIALFLAVVFIFSLSYSESKKRRLFFTDCKSGVNYTELVKKYHEEYVIDNYYKFILTYSMLNNAGEQNTQKGEKEYENNNRH